MNTLHSFGERQEWITIYFASPVPSSSGSLMPKFLQSGLQVGSVISPLTVRLGERGIELILSWLLQLLWGFLQAPFLTPEFINTRLPCIYSYFAITCLLAFSFFLHVIWALVSSASIFLPSQFYLHFVFQQLFRISAFLLNLVFSAPFSIYFPYPLFLHLLC